MKRHPWTIVAALLIGAPISAVAQSQTQHDDQASTNTSQSQQSLSAPVRTGENKEGIWLASGFVGSNFANNANPASVNLGGSFGYLWKNRIGAELDVGITPNFQLENDFFGIGETTGQQLHGEHRGRVSSRIRVAVAAVRLRRYRGALAAIQS
jgi:hypothetical protein